MVELYHAEVTKDILFYYINNKTCTCGNCTIKINVRGEITPTGILGESTVGFAGIC